MNTVLFRYPVTQVQHKERNLCSFLTRVEGNSSSLLGKLKLCTKTTMKLVTARVPTMPTSSQGPTF